MNKANADDDEEDAGPKDKEKDSDIEEILGPEDKEKDSDIDEILSAAIHHERQGSAGESDTSTFEPNKDTESLSEEEDEDSASPPTKPIQKLKSKSKGAQLKALKRTPPRTQKKTKAQPKGKAKTSVKPATKRKRDMSHESTDEEEKHPKSRGKKLSKRKRHHSSESSDDEPEVIVPKRATRLVKNQPKLENKLRVTMASAAAAASGADHDDINFSEEDVKKAVYMQLCTTGRRVATTDAATIRDYVYDKGLIGSSNPSLLEELYQELGLEDIDVVARDKIRTKVTNVNRTRREYKEMIMTDDVALVGMRLGNLIKKFSTCEGAKDSLNEVLQVVSGDSSTK